MNITRNVSLFTIRIRKKQTIYIIGCLYRRLYLILKDYDDFLKQQNKSGLIELNISCPNLHSIIAGYHKKDIAS